MTTRPIVHHPMSLARTAWDLYRDAPVSLRIIQSLRPFICPFDRIIPLVPDGSDVLDVGCGAGLLLNLIAASGRPLSLTGFDSCQKAISAATSAAGRNFSLGRQQGRFTVVDARSAWPSGTFGVVTLIDVLHHIPVNNRREVISRACAATASGGSLIVKDIAPRPRWRALMNCLHDLVMTREWVRYTNLDEVEEWALSMGMVSAHRERIFRLWYGHDLLVMTKPSE